MDATELCYTPATDLDRLIRTRAVSPVEVTRTVLARIERLNPRLNAFLTVTADLALAQAKASEERARRGGRLGPWTGSRTRSRISSRPRGSGPPPGRSGSRSTCPGGWRGGRPAPENRRRAPGQDQHA